jgi:hypothetical protein
MTALKSNRTSTTIDSSSIDPRDVVAVLRASVLRLVPGDIEVDLDESPISVWGLVIETAHPDAVASLIVLADGSVSLYVSDGTGCVGCGAHRDVRFAGADLLEVAERSVVHTIPTDDTAYPPPGHIRFYFLRDGLSSVQIRMEELNSVGSQLGALYFAGQRVINAIERVGAGQSIAQEIRLARLAGQSTSTKGAPACLSVGNAVRRLPR